MIGAQAADRIVISPSLPRPWARARWISFTGGQPVLPPELVDAPSGDFGFTWPETSETEPSPTTRRIRLKEEVFPFGGKVMDYHKLKQTAVPVQWARGHVFATKSANLEIRGMGVAWPEGWEERKLSSRPLIQSAWTGPNDHPLPPDLEALVQDNASSLDSTLYGSTPTLHLAIKVSAGPTTFELSAPRFADTGAEVAFDDSFS